MSMWVYVNNLRASTAKHRIICLKLIFGLHRFLTCLIFFIEHLQRARFKAVESLRHPKKRVVVVCTDVAARGLDIPTVSTVVHYDVARAVDTFVHRSGRTAVSVD